MFEINYELKAKNMLCSWC